MITWGEAGQAAFAALSAPGAMAVVAKSLDGVVRPTIAIKMDRQMEGDAPSLRKGTFICTLTPQLGRFDTGAVLCFHVRVVVDDTSTNTAPLPEYGFEVFANVAADGDADFLNAWQTAPQYAIVFCNQAGETVVAKAVRLRPITHREVAGLVVLARQHNATCARLDFSKAKQEMQEMTKI